MCGNFRTSQQRTQGTIHSNIATSLATNAQSLHQATRKTRFRKASSTGTLFSGALRTNATITGLFLVGDVLTLLALRNVPERSQQSSQPLFYSVHMCMCCLCLQLETNMHGTHSERRPTSHQKRSCHTHCPQPRTENSHSTKTAHSSTLWARYLFTACERFSL